MRRRRGGRQQCSRSGRCRTARRMGKFDPKATIEIYPMNGRKARESGLSDMLHPSRVLLWPSGAVCGGAGGVGRGPEARPQFLDRAQAPNPAVQKPGGFRAPAGRLAKSGRGGIMRQASGYEGAPAREKNRGHAVSGMLNSHPRFARSASYRARAARTASGDCAGSIAQYP